jgi:hypothetical protein
VYVLHKSSLHEVLADFPEIKSKLEKVAEERLQEMLLKSRFTSQFPAINEDLDIENESKGH